MSGFAFISLMESSAIIAQIADWHCRVEIAEIQPVISIADSSCHLQSVNLEGIVMRYASQ